MSILTLKTNQMLLLQRGQEPVHRPPEDDDDSDDSAKEVEPDNYENEDIDTFQDMFEPPQPDDFDDDEKAIDVHDEPLPKKMASTFTGPSTSKNKQPLATSTPMKNIQKYTPLKNLKKKKDTRVKIDEKTEIMREYVSEMRDLKQSVIRKSEAEPPKNDELGDWAKVLVAKLRRMDDDLCEDVRFKIDSIVYQAVRHNKLD